MNHEKRGKLISPNPFDLPSNLSEIYRDVEQRCYGLLQAGQFEEARQSWEHLYKLFLEKQKALGYRLHKGGIVHNLGIVALLANDIELAFKNFVLGFAEDVASQEQRFAGEAEKAPGAQNLKTFYGVGTELFDLVRRIVTARLSEGKFNDPRLVFKVFLKTKVEEKPVKDRIETLKKYPFVIQKKHSINRMPSEWNRRVFIGGNYSSDRVGILFEIKKAVERNGFFPILALDFNDKELPIHDHSLLLLHNCKYAIFDVSTDSGYLMEVERTLDYRTITLLVYEEKPEYRITEMMTSLQKLRRFSNNDELKKMVDEFLSGKPTKQG